MKSSSSGKQELSAWKLLFSGLLFSLLVTSCGTPGGNVSRASYYQITGASNTGTYAIQRVQLDFAQGLNSTTVTKGQKLSPVAQIKFQGRGVFLANWLVDDLVVEQVNISLGHGSLLTLSPKSSTRVPTFVLGRHSIRLKINRPEVDFREPKLSYFVSN